ncbi:hypothetical protein ZYGR_0BB01360 [Zygosaccharomyces rouxii]|uniref:Uncharacterized protein n=1 Tax=Zygosaccharomyces rouxii TaxID=4956 RepID=A0A1Q3AKU6_ZYGRO|nr:hypothetical protein ZYGR_0BB01360 [Zygosaccharomyces rouxii]
MATESFTFGHLAYLVFEAVLQAVLVAVAGFWAAHVGLLPKAAQKYISLLNVDLFTPALIFSKLGRNLSLAKIVEISIIPLFFALTTTISFFCGKVTAKIMELDKDESNFVVANSVFGNSNSLPVSLTVSLAYSLPNLTWDQIPNDNRDNVASRGLLYLLIFQQIGQMLRWSWGFNTLMRWSGENQHHMPPSQIQAHLEARRQDEESISQNDDSNAQYVQQSENGGVITSSFWSKLWNRAKMVGTKVRSQLNPPLYSMLIAVLVAAIPPIQHELYHEDGFVNNTFAEAIDQLGLVSIPLILLVLGSNLYPSEDTLHKTHNHKKLIIGSIFGRMILPSCVLLPIIAVAVKYINVSILDDPIFLVVGFLLTVSPPAIQLTQITQLNEFFEAEMASILFWGYVVLSLPVSILVVSGAIYTLQWAEGGQLS